MIQLVFILFQEAVQLIRNVFSKMFDTKSIRIGAIVTITTTICTISITGGFRTAIATITCAIINRFQAAFPRSASLSFFRVRNVAAAHLLRLIASPVHHGRVSREILL